jgi:phosphoenolpyruvate-protein kinase (PTS system EI component)
MASAGAAELVQDVSRLVAAVAAMSDQISALYEQLEESDRQRAGALAEVRRLLAEDESRAERRASMRLVAGAAKRPTARRGKLEVVR